MTEKMVLIPIERDESRNELLLNNPDCIPVLQVYPDYYARVGFDKPWIGYIAGIGEDLVGAGGFKGKPKDGKIEIAYGTFKRFEGRGIGTEICRQLILLASETDPSLRITARTLPVGHASMAILKKNGFKSLGYVQDEDDGEVIEWELIKTG